eukprot:522827-Amphidinium_carterae.1
MQLCRKHTQRGASNKSKRWQASRKRPRKLIARRLLLTATAAVWLVSRQRLCPTRARSGDRNLRIVMLATSPAQTAPLSLAASPALRGVTQVAQQDLQQQVAERQGCRSLMVATSAAVATALTAGPARKA